MTFRVLQPTRLCGISGHPSTLGLMRAWYATNIGGGTTAESPQMWDAVTGALTTGIASVQTSISRALGYPVAGNGLVGVNFPSSINLAHLTAGTQNPVTTQKISVMGLIVPQLTSAGYIVSRWQNGATAGDQFVLLYGLTAGKARFYVSTGGAASNSGDSTTTMSVGTPYMLGGSSTGTTQTVYINGKSEASASGQTMNAAPTTNYLLGQSGFNDGGFTGELYFAAVWNRVLTANEWRDLARNPWMLFSQPTVPIWALAAVAGVGRKYPLRVQLQAVNRGGM